MRKLRAVGGVLILGAGLWSWPATASPPPLPEDPFSRPSAAAAPKAKAPATPSPSADPQAGPEADPEPQVPAADSDEEGVEETSREVVVGSFFGPGLPRVVGSAHVITERELEAYEQDDIHQVLSRVPGVYVRGEDAYGLRPNIGMRGANSDRSAKVTLMEDGILMAPAPYAAPAAYFFPLTTRMVGVEVFKGPAAVRHGPNTIGGAINLRSREIPTSPMGFVDLAGGRFGYGKAHGHVGSSYKGFGFVLEGARVQTRGFKQLDNGTDTGFGKNDAMLKLGYRSPDTRKIQHIVELKGGFANERSFETYLGLSDADFRDNPYQRYAGSQLGLMKWWRSQAEATYVLSDRGVLEFEGRLYRHDLSRAWRKMNRFRDGPDLNTLLASPDAGQNAIFHSILTGEEDSVTPEQAVMVGTNDRRYVSQGIASAFRWRPTWQKWGQELELGVRLHTDSIERDHTEDGYAMTSGVLVRDDSERLTTTLNRGSAIAGAFHLHDTITFLDRFTVAPGIRVELISTGFEERLGPNATDSQARRFDAVPVPGLGFHVAATDWLGVFGGVHRGFSPVAPGQPAEVEPEFSINYEAGAMTTWEGLHAEAVGFFSDYSNLTGECTFSGGCADTDVNLQFNGGQVYVYGLESLLRYERVVTERFRFQLGAQYTYTGSMFRSDFESSLPQFGEVTAGDALAYVPPHIVGGEAGVGGKIWDLRAKGVYTSAMRDVPGQGDIPRDQRINGFFVLDVSGEVTVLRMVRLYGLVQNATASRYMVSRRPFGARPGAPLTVVFGVKGFLSPGMIDEDARAKRKQKRKAKRARRQPW